MNEKSVYLIFRDSMDDYSEVLGYVICTEEEVSKYCLEYNEKVKHSWEAVEYTLIENLLDKENHPD